MKKIIARVLLISDLHRLSVGVGEQKGQALKWHEKVFEGIINIWKRWNIEYAIPKMMRKISQMTTSSYANFDYQIINGDVIEAEYNERGMVSYVDHLVIRKVISEIPSSVRSEKTFVVPGDHELGYRLPLSTDPYGGISTGSLDYFQHVVGPLWQSFSLEGINFLMISSSLMIQNFSHLSEIDQEEVLSLREDQRRFIRYSLEKIPAGESVIIFLHDPDAIVELHGYIRDFFDMHNKNLVVFCGHMHAEFSLKAYKKLGEIAKSKYAFLLPRKICQWAKGNWSRLELFEKYKLHVVPAPGGMMGIGGGFKVLNIYDDKTFETEKYKV